MSEEELKQVEEILLKFYDKALEIVELLKPLNQKQLQYLQLSYDIVHKQTELDKLKELNVEEVKN